MLNNSNDLHIIGFSENIKVEDFSKDYLIDLMIANWIPYMECHKCGKSDYCKYAEPHGVNPEKKAEIKCGVAQDFIRNYINITFDAIQDLSKEQKQAYLDAAYYLSQYVQSAEINIGTFISEDHLSGWGSYAPALYGFTKQTLEYLDKAHREMKHLEMFKSKKNVILVEGFSEEIFVKSFSDIEVRNYEGKGRIDFSKIEFLVKDYQEKGYEVYLQTDKDGKPENQNVNKIIKNGLIRKECIFQFKHDFETSIPLKKLYEILRSNEIIDALFEDFEKDLDLKSGIVKHIENKYTVGINKRMIANEISLMINNLSRRTNLYYDENFLDTEIGKFWNFIKRII